MLVGIMISYVILREADTALRLGLHTADTAFLVFWVAVNVVEYLISQWWRRRHRRGTP
jgi:uncharacterized membrane protein YeiB